MKLLIVSATPFEIAPLLSYLEKFWDKKSYAEFELNDNTIYLLVSGVGSINTTFALSRYPNIAEIDLAINVGIGGSFTPSVPIGTTVEIVKDRFGDLGVEESDGSFTDVFEMELEDKNKFPYVDGWILNNPKLELDLIKASGITVNKVHGQEASIAKIKSKYKAHVESMEGASFLYACQMLSLKCHQIRSISNHVEPRNKDNWKVNEAIDNLNNVLLDIIVNL